MATKKSPDTLEALYIVFKKLLFEFGVFVLEFVDTSGRIY